MTQGVVLLAANKRSYAFFAYNLAMSIKYHNPNIKIALLHDHCIENLWKAIYRMAIDEAIWVFY